MMKNNLLKLLFCISFVLNNIIPKLVYSQVRIEHDLLDKIDFRNSPIGRLRSPEGISVDLNGNLYIADSGNNRIIKATIDGRILDFKGGFGWGNEQFDEPVAISSLNGLNIYVADKNNSRLTRFDIQLNYLSTINLNNFSDTKYNFNYPSDLIVSSTGDLFLLDTEQDRVIKINSFGRPELEFGGINSPGVTLGRPQKMAIYKRDKIYITDNLKKEVTIFDYYGNFLGNIGKKLLEDPFSITIDDDGLIYVGDLSTKNIIIFDGSGRIISKIEQNAGIAASDLAVYKNILFVLDKEKSIILKFNLYKS